MDFRLKGFAPSWAWVFVGILIAGFFSLPVSALSFEIQSPRDGSDLAFRETVILVDDCRVEKPQSTPYFRVLLDGTPLSHQILKPRSDAVEKDAQKHGQFALAIALPLELSEDAHRLTVEASCSGKARSDSVRVTFQTRSVLETAWGLARNLRAQVRSDEARWDFSHGLFALGLAEVSQVSDPLESGLLQDWLTGYHLGFEQRESSCRKLDTPMEVFPALSALVLGRSFLSAKTAADFIQSAPRNSLGLLDRRGTDFWRKGSLAGSSAEEILGYVVFAAEWAKQNQDAELLNWAAKAPQLFATKLWDLDSGYYHQTWFEWGDRVRNAGKSFHFRTQASVGQALVRILEILPQNHPDRPSLIRQYQGLMAALVKDQLPSGAWALSEKEAGILSGETTTTALIAATLMRGVRLGLLEPRFLKPARAAWNHLLSRTQAVPADDRALARYSVDQMAAWPAASRGLRCMKEDLPHGVGAVLLLASEWVRMGGRGEFY